MLASTVPDADNQRMNPANEAIAAPEALSKAQLHRLVALRWMSVAMMLLAVFPLPASLGLRVPTEALLAVMLAMTAANLFTLSWLARNESIPRAGSALFLQLCIDIAGWSAFLYFAGGATNPLISLLLPLVAIGATILPATQAWLLALMAVGAYSLLWNFYLPIRLHDAALAMRWHLAGMWLTFALSAGVIVGFVARMTAALRNRDRSLAAAKAAIARDEHIVALGNLAAGAAHNLGTPLGTMRIITDELLRSTQLQTDTRADLELMRTQVDQCRKILSQLTAEAGEIRAEGGRSTGAGDWINETVAQWQVQRPHVMARVHCGASLAQIRIVADATLSQALQTLINNAADASPESVEVHAQAEARGLIIEVRDRGPGMPATQLAVAGNRPWTDRPAGMGIGIFLARNTLDRCRGSLEFEARASGGTVARMIIPLEQIRA